VVWLKDSHDLTPSHCCIIVLVSYSNCLSHQERLFYSVLLNPERRIIKRHDSTALYLSLLGVGLNESS
jgi:hypothetical protein